MAQVPDHRLIPLLDLAARNCIAEESALVGTQFRFGHGAIGQKKRVPMRAPFSNQTLRSNDTRTRGCLPKAQPPVRVMTLMTSVVAASRKTNQARSCMIKEGRV